MPVVVKINKRWSLDVEQGLEKGLAEMVTDIDRRSKMITPIQTGNLVNSQRISRLGAFAYLITSGGGRVPYARRQYYENKRKPRWLEKAADSVIRGNTEKYFRNKGI